MSCVLWLEILGSVFYGIPAWIIVVLVLCNILLVPEPWHLVTLANKWQAWRQ
ncbi:hypothetical protein FC83_GL003175 [Agrilactobacillus composti DSM 18527 = JCM 14202]|uniref:Uncharacterized protein n=2 Tax=Agrilactobacillus TaxID=2767875 RepID=A0A0R1Y0D1_9LACO|nr:hypothetical protein FC83_GL003175 [Agrilactobacillus composti DSM 18527 = JCM 14202]